ncbi:hypothetical protein BH20ACT19_BH20ACT19_02560 [soil metagenome]
MPAPASASPPVVRRAAAALALLIVLLVTGCDGGDAPGARDEERDVQALLERAFRTPVESADLIVDAQLELEGLEGFDSPVRLEASGPFVAREGTLPLLDLDVTFGVQGAGQAIEVGFLSTGDRAFLEFAGELYEQPATDVRRANRELRRRLNARAGGSLRALGLDPRGWVDDASDEGIEDVGGVRTDHVSARLDVPAMLADLNGLVERSGDAVSGGRAQPLPAAEVERLADLLESTRIDVYAGAREGRIRRMSANLELVVPEDQRERLGGVERGSLRISIELGDVNGDQRVEAPASARPISDLATQLRGIGALGGAGGLTLPGEGSENGALPGAPGALDRPEGAEDESGASEIEALRRYDECLDEAAPDDTAALTRCSSLLPPR